MHEWNDKKIAKVDKIKMWRNSGIFISFWWISRAWPTLDWTWWWLWRLHCLWLISSLSSCCHGSITWSLLGLFTRPKEGRRLMAVKPVGTLVVEWILFRNLCPPIKTKLSDKVASCSFAAPFHFTLLQGIYSVCYCIVHDCSLHNCSLDDITTFYMTAVYSALECSV